MGYLPTDIPDLLLTTSRNPFLLVARSYTILALLLVFVPPKPPHRLAAVGLMGIFIFDAFKQADPWQVSRFNLDFCGGIQFGILWYSNVFLYLNPQSPPATATSFLKKFSWALHYNPRGIGTPWEIKHIPPFSYKDPSYIPSRTIFIITRSLTAISSVLVLLGFARIDTYYWERLGDGQHRPERESLIRRLHQVDMYEFLDRLYFPVRFFLPAYCQLATYHCLLSVIAVFTGDEPRSWPPSFGSPADAYTLRRFWSRFWHQFYARAFVLHTDLFAHKLLVVRNGTGLNRTIMTSATFLISGLMHGLANGLYGHTCEVWPLVYWFGVLLPLGILLEDLARGVWQRLMVERLSNWHYGIGYVWVWAFYAWSLPKLVYPIIECRMEVSSVEY